MSLASLSPARERAVWVPNVRHKAMRDLSPAAKYALSGSKIGFLKIQDVYIEPAPSAFPCWTSDSPHPPPDVRSLTCKRNRILKAINIVRSGMAGQSAMAAFAAHGKMNTTASSKRPKVEAVADAT